MPKYENSLKKNKGKTTKGLLNNTLLTDKEPLALEKLENFWKNLLKTPSTKDDRVSNELSDKGPLLTEIVQPLLKSDLDLALKGAQGAPGPDRTQWHELKSKTEELAQRFNYYLATGKIPSRLLKGKTTLIPKDLDNIYDPTKYRPITVSSTIVRLFHKVLAKRLEKHLPIDEFQRGFRSGDGVSLNLQLLQSAINKAKTKFKNLYLYFIDLSKAFDSVSHESVIVAGRRLGMHEVFLKYIYTSLGLLASLGVPFL